jgi:hypothetical protein
MKLSRIEMYAFMFAAAILSGWYAWNEAAKRGEPVENWLVVRNIAIPDFIEGENPIIIYDREHRREASIRRNVDIHRAGNIDGDPVCSGRNVKALSPAGNLGDVNIPLSDFVSAPCSPGEGMYVAQVSWIVAAKGYPPKRLTYVSNVFRVLPKGSLSYVPPEQVQQLEKAQELLNNPKILEQMQ